MKKIFKTKNFVFPYTDITFPGQTSDERILYVTREAPIMLYLRFFFVSLVALVLFISGWLAADFFKDFIGISPALIRFLGLILGVFFGLIGFFWAYCLWQKSIFILTNHRLTKFIYVTPWNRYNLSLALEQVVDTGAYTRGYFEAIFKLGTFTARSSAGARKEKYFFISKIHAAEDLANYVNKTLIIFNKDRSKLINFRPFIPFLKSQARKDFMKDYPQYWS